MVQSHHKQTVINALTFDVEYWFDGFKINIPPSVRHDLQPRLSVGLLRVLNLLDKYKVKATFFILGQLVTRWRSLLGQIVDAGHEIAVHSYQHLPIYRFSQLDFAHDLQQALKELRTLTKQPIQSYRAPFFSITQQSLWALPILANAGITRDSSIVPSFHPRYGIPSANRFPHFISMGKHARLMEYPISTIALGKINLPFSGGFYARFLPYKLIRRAVKQLNANGQAAIFYFHPWELDPDQPRISREVPALFRFTHYHRLNSTMPKLEALLREFSFCPLADLPPPTQTCIYNSPLTTGST